MRERTTKFAKSAGPPDPRLLTYHLSTEYILLGKYRIIGQNMAKSMKLSGFYYYRGIVIKYKYTTNV